MFYKNIIKIRTKSS